MNIYDTEDIRRVADCRDLIRNELHGNERKKPNGYDCPWRAGSDSGAVKVELDKWYDHVAKEGGDAINLIMKGKNMDFLQANEWLGDHYHLTVKTKPEEKPMFLCEYIYTDAEGNQAHKTIRFIPKHFSQQIYRDGEWISGKGVMEGITTYLYNLPEVIKAVKAKKWIFLPEGEKDCNNLKELGFCATTQPMGGGKWKQSYTDTLAGANVCMIKDKDKVGGDHEKLVAPLLFEACNKFKIIEMPGDGIKDFTEWKEAGGTADQFKQIVKDAPAYDPEQVFEEEVEEESTKRTKELAKELNRKPFSNFTYESVQAPDGTSQTVKKAVQINVLLKEILDRFMDFPRLVSDTLFDHDKNTGEIRMLNSPTALFAWIQVKSNQTVNWTKIEGAVSQEQVYLSLISEVKKKYNVISGVPAFPERKDAYYTFHKLPAPDADNIHFETFLNFFNPSDEFSKLRLRAFIASPLYYKAKIDRPLWVIDSETAQGSGKTKLVEAIAALYGSDAGDDGEPFWVNSESLKTSKETEAVYKRLLSGSGRRKRIVLIDNVTGFLKAPTLATLVTQGSASGLAPYGHGEETRPNDLTYVITSNSGNFGQDLIDRSIFIKINKKTNPDPRWAEKVFNYISKYRLNILSEIISILNHKVGEDVKTYTRFRTWELDIMAPMIGSEELRKGAVEDNIEIQKAANYDQENAEELRKFLSAKIELRYGKDAKVFIPYKFLRDWFEEALPDANIPKKMVVQIVKNWASANLIQELNTKVKKHSGVCGIGWNIDKVGYGDWKDINIYSDYVM